MNAQHLDPFPFVAGGKAVGVTESADGSLLIEGWAAVFDNLDREGDVFDGGALTAGVKAFLNNGSSALCYQHDRSTVLGRVLDLQVKPGKGVWMRARVDRQVPGSPWHHLYNGIKAGSIRNLSVGGFFRRAMVNGVRKIVAVDMTEISATAVPMDTSARFDVVAGKALIDAPAAGADELLSDLALIRAQASLARLELASAGR
jgi:HK97 family phage prohead protease